MDYINFSNCGICNDAFNLNVLSADAAAHELAKYPEYQDNAQAQDAILREYGIILDDLTDDEADYISSLVEQYAKAGR
jgi:hypothetical protein